MFPDPCGEAFEKAVAAGADPALVVPDEFFVVRGGIKPWSPQGTRFSVSVGPTVESAAAAVPHGTIRISTAGQIRANSGIIKWAPELSQRSTMNLQHAHVIETGTTTFGSPTASPVPKRLRIDGGK